MKWQYNLSGQIKQLLMLSYCRLNKIDYWTILFNRE